MPITINDGGLRIGSCRIRWGTLPPDLNVIATHLRPWLTVGHTSGGLRPDGMYNYNLDGNQFYISDGGGDMFDGGNYTYQTQDNAALGYSQTTTQSVSKPNGINYDYISLGYQQGLSPNVIPLTMLSVNTKDNITSGFFKDGNLGADGAGFVQSQFIYYNIIVNGFTTYAFMRRVYGASDPEVCDLYMLLGHNSWGSQFGPVMDYSSTSTDSQYGYLYTTTNARNVLAIVTLLSSPSSAETCQTIVQNYTNLIGQVI